MQRAVYVKKMTVSALLIAIGIMIPVFSPAKIVLPPASFTLASHVPVFMAMFISPWAAFAVSLGTTFGFFLGSFPLVIVMRAATHFVFACTGSLWLTYRPQTIKKPVQTQVFSFVLALVHAGLEVLIVSLFYVGGNMPQNYYNSGFLTSVFLLVGLGTVVHSMADFLITLVLLSGLKRQKQVAEIFPLLANETREAPCKHGMDE